MDKTSLSNVDGVVMLAIPGSMLVQLGWEVGDMVGIYVDQGRLIVEPNPKPRYTLEELLAASDPSRPLSAEVREWLDSPPVGRELL